MVGEVFVLMPGGALEGRECGGRGQSERAAAAGKSTRDTTQHSVAGKAGQAGQSVSLSVWTAARPVGRMDGWVVAVVVGR